MTTTPEKAPAEQDLVTLTIDGIEVSVPKDTLVIRAAEQIGVQVPRFCDHPLLDPVGAWPTWVLSNHDNPRHRTRYGSEETLR